MWRYIKRFSTSQEIQSILGVVFVVFVVVCCGFCWVWFVFLIYFWFGSIGFYVVWCFVSWRRLVSVETSVAVLILVVSAVVISCVVVDYAVSIVEATLNTRDIPQLVRLREMQGAFLNETDGLFNSTLPAPLEFPVPAP